jgi:hypothetical protein
VSELTLYKQCPQQNIKMIYTNIKHLVSITYDKKYNHYTKIRQIVEETEKKNVANFLKAFETEFKKLNLNYVLATFSGGHDEGGYDAFSFLNSKKEEVTFKNVDCEPHSYIHRTLVKKENENKKKEVISVDVFYYEEHLFKRLDQINMEEIFYKLGALERFGSFAGEFSVHGEVELNLLTGTYKLDGDETVEEYTKIKDEGNINIHQPEAAL